MKKTAENRYPNSAVLFKFCKEALEIRYDGNVKVIDQDVGAILGYDPADCSHWKKGKKNIRSLSTLKSIADHLDIDERLLIDIASGKMDLDEALYEFKGYGAFQLNGKNLENLKKEYFKNPTKWQATNITSFEELFDVNRVAICKIANELIANCGFTETPIYVPEITRQLQGMNLITNESQAEAITVTVDEANVTTISLKSAEMKPYLRFITAREIYKHLLRTKNPLVANFFNVPAEVAEIQANIFAGVLLIPAKLLKSEVEKIDSSLDLISQLADIFWVSKALMNQRLRDYMENLV